jgi:microcystin-dependent protein
MKQIYTLLTFLLLGLTSIAQTSTKGFSFQGYAIDPDGKALGSTAITVQFTISPSTGTGGTYVETYSLTTDPFGVFSAIIGEGSKVSGQDFKTLDFTRVGTRYKLKVEVKKTSGGVYATISDSDFNAVPYARQAENGVPVGTIISFAGPKNKIPEGWALCDGSSQDGTSTQWKQLFDVLGTSWGGSGNNFNLPDLRGMFLRGVNDTRADGLKDPDAATRTASNTGGNTGNEAGTVQADEFQSHNHNVTDPGHTHGITDPGHTHGIMSSSSDSEGGSNDYGNNHNRTNNTFSATTGITVNSATTGVTIQTKGGTETRPNNVYVYYIIKY